jgi:trehalose 6-phosphate phosphatase
LPEANGLLGRLSERLAIVAVISGRPLSYLMTHLAGAGRTELVGLYGLERTSQAGIRATEGDEWRLVVESVAAKAETDAPTGVVVERKGLTVTLHYRSAPQNRDWVERFAATVTRSTGLAAHSGKMSVELRPPVRTDKGTVVAELASGLDAVMFVGDDIGDIPAFTELSGLANVGVKTLSIAVLTDETAPEVTEAADATVEGPAGVVDLLRLLLAPED